VPAMSSLDESLTISNELLLPLGVYV